MSKKNNHFGLLSLFVFAAVFYVLTIGGGMTPAEVKTKMTNAASYLQPPS